MRLRTREQRGRKPRPAEVLDSLEDEFVMTSLSRTKAVLGLLAIHVGALAPKRRFRLVSAEVLFVVNNPVRHGSAFASAVAGGLTERGVSARVIADERLSDLQGVSLCHFPGVGVRSLTRWSTWRSLQFGWSVARIASRAERKAETSRWVVRYLAVAQSVRYCLAADAVDRAASDWPATLTDFDRGAYAAPWVSALRRRDLPVATLVHGSPSASYLPVTASAVYVWGEAQQEFFSAAGVESVEIVGRPDWFSREVDTGEVRRLVICHSMEQLAPEEVARLRRLIGWADGHGVPTVVRWHPRHRLDSPPPSWEPVALAAASTGPAEKALLDFLRPGDLVVVVASTVGVEALCHGFRVAIAGEPSRALPCDLEALRQATEKLWLKGDTTINLEALDADVSSVRRHILAYEGNESVHRILESMHRLGRQGSPHPRPRQAPWRGWP